MTLRRSPCHRGYSLFQDLGHREVFDVQKSVSIFKLPLCSGNLNPTFRVYKYDVDTYELLDYIQYFLDLDEADHNRIKDL